MTTTNKGTQEKDSSPGDEVLLWRRYRRDALHPWADTGAMTLSAAAPLQVEVPAGQTRVVDLGFAVVNRAMLVMAAPDLGSKGLMVQTDVVPPDQPLRVRLTNVTSVVQVLQPGHLIASMLPVMPPHRTGYKLREHARE